MIYLDNAATSYPKPEKVYVALGDAARKFGANPGRGGYGMSLRSSEEILDCRENLAKLFSIEHPEQIVFTDNATHALNIAIQGCLSPGDHVIISSMEHNSVLRPMRKLEQRGVMLDIAKADGTGKVSANSVSALLRKNTRLICITHASNVCGTINPIYSIGRIASKANALFLVDAAQTAGILPIDVKKMNIDLLAFPGHKGLLGPQGTGGLYIRKGLPLETIIQGGTGSQSENEYQPTIMPDRFESGTLNTPGIIALNEGLRYILGRGHQSIINHEMALIKHLLEGLDEIEPVRVIGPRNPKNRVATVAFVIDGMDSVEAASMLDEHFDIAVRAGLHCSPLAHKTLGTLHSGAIRVSPGLFNTLEEVEAFIAAIHMLVTNI